MIRDDLTQARILAVDDEQANLDLLERILEPAGFTEIRSTTHASDALELCESWEPDIVLLDLLMPGVDGFEFLERLSALKDPEEYLPVVILTSDQAQQTRRKALRDGAHDFLTKPLSPAEVRLRVQNLLQTRFLHLALVEQNRTLEERVRKRTADLERARYEILARLARAAEFRDDDTGQHTRRVGDRSARIAGVLGLGDEEEDLIRRVAPLHDVGKIAIPDAILLSPNPLTDAERALMQTHTTVGSDLLSGSGFELLDRAAEVARAHHERWDGAGYPAGLSADDIPLSGRIVAVADTWDALVHERPYKRAWSVDEAWAELESGAGSRFDPEVVDAFGRALREDRA